MKFSIQNIDYAMLYVSVCSALRRSFSNVAANESQLIANLVWWLPRNINAIALSGGMKVDVGGVFVHSQPYVKSSKFPDKGKKYIEIGDVLLVRSDMKNGVISQRRALLLQAKKVAQYPVSLPARRSEINQCYLYNKWPDFEYVRSGSLSGQRRHITGRDLYDAGRFLLIETAQGCSGCACGVLGFPSPYCCALTASPTQPKLTQHREFAREIVDFILGDVGKAFVRPPRSNSKNWDKVVDDLIRETAVRTSSFIKNASSSVSNVRGQGMYCILSGVQRGFNGLSFDDVLVGIEGDEIGPPNIQDEHRADENGDGGINIINFVVSHDNVVDSSEMR